jgi:hypothetical protein
MSDVQYRKTKKGEWVVMGPVDAVDAGEDVTVTRKNGTTKNEFVLRVSKPFDVDGVEMVYGFITDPDPAGKDAPASSADEPMVSVPVSLVKRLASFID